jgi:putative ABC transport system permease protein
MKEDFWIAFRSLSQRRLRSWLTMIGIFIGIAAVVSLIGLGEGLRIAITSQFGFLGTDILSIQASGVNFGPPGQGAANPLDDTLIDKIEKLNGVDTAFGRIIKSGILEFKDTQYVGYVASVPEGSDRKVFEKMVNIEAESGRLLRDTDKNKVVLGSSFATEDFFGRAVATGDTIILNGKEFEVAGMLLKKGSFIFDGVVFVNEEELKDLYNIDTVTSVIAVKVKDEQQMDKVKADIEKLLRKERDVKLGEEDFQVQSPQKALEALNDTLFAVQLFVYIIATISLVVGGIGIMNTMYTAVLERTKEIGIMKAIGARNSTIFRLFFIESGFLGLVGGIIGTLLGMGLAYGLAFAGRQAGSNLLQASVSPYLIIGSLLFSFILGTLFGVLPAVNASKMQPVEALRK